jgi:TonB family protein
MYNCVDYTLLGLRTTRKESIIKKRTLQGLLLSLLLHLFLFLLFVKNFQEIKFLPPPAQEKKISLNLKQIVTAAPKPQPAPKPKPLPKPLPQKPPVPEPVKVPQPKPLPPKPAVAKEKPLDKKTLLFAEKKESEERNATKKSAEKKVKTVKKEVKRTKRKSIAKKAKPRKRKHRRKRSRDSLANALMGSGTSSLYPSSRSRPSSSGSYGRRMIRKLYGKEFDSYSPSQKSFIKNNLGIIHRITQRTLIRNGYPEVAIQTRQQGTNIVSFYLHPNGDISGLRLKGRTGYAALDQNTLEVIRIAYKNYPLPNKKTKIVFYVTYSIY